MIDFRKLEPPTAAELKTTEQRRRTQEIEADTDRRTERSSRRITVILSHDADHRFTMSGTRAIHLHAVQEDGRSVRAIWYAPDHATDDQIQAVYAPLTEGTRLRLDGYWKPHKNREDKTCFTFMAQFIQPLAPPEERRPRTSPDDQMNAFG
jgi:hypothetical protein